MLSLLARIFSIMLKIVLAYPNAYHLFMDNETCTSADQQTSVLQDMFEDIVLQEQIIFFWPIDLLHVTNVPGDRVFPIFGVCPGVILRPSGRFVQKSLPDGVVSFWVLHAEITLTCPPISSNAHNFALILDHWNEPMVWPPNSGEDNHVTSGLHHSVTPTSARLECTKHVSTTARQTISGYVRRIRLTWTLVDAKELSNLAPLQVFIRVTSRMLFTGSFSPERKRVLCEFFSGFWCGASNRPVCVQANMRCDGLPDCEPSLSNVDRVNQSEDEENCEKFPGNVSYRWDPERNATFRDQWTARLPWLILAPIPIILACALVRICSQKRQLELAEHGDCDKPPTAECPRQSRIGHRWRRSLAVRCLPSVKEVDEADSEGEHPAPPISVYPAVFYRSLPSIYLSTNHAHEISADPLRPRNRKFTCCLWNASSSSSELSACSQCETSGDMVQRQSRSLEDLRAGGSSLSPMSRWFCENDALINPERDWIEMQDLKCASTRPVELPEELLQSTRLQIPASIHSCTATEISSPITRPRIPSV